VCVREREGEGGCERGCGRIWGREDERESVCVCARERGEDDGERVCARKRDGKED
jgi:hypothetical protein